MNFDIDALGADASDVSIVIPTLTIQNDWRRVCPYFSMYFQHNVDLPLDDFTITYLQTEWEPLSTRKVIESGRIDYHFEGIPKGLLSLVDKPIEDSKSIADILEIQFASWSSNIQFDNPIRGMTVQEFIFRQRYWLWEDLVDSPSDVPVFYLSADGLISQTLDEIMNQSPIILDSAVIGDMVFLPLTYSGDVIYHKTQPCFPTKYLDWLDHQITDWVEIETNQELSFLKNYQIEHPWMSKYLPDKPLTVLSKTYSTDEGKRPFVYTLGRIQAGE